MLQITQYQKTGELKVEELPIPQIKEGYVLVKNYYSAVSAGTERTSVETAQASMIGKAKSRPDLVKQVLENVQREGLSATYKKVQNRMDNYKELGYSSSGVVVETGTSNFKVGDRVACAGPAHHAEYVLIPKNLTAKVPDIVAMEEAAYTTIGAIAMQGIRQADVRVGEIAVVIGLGIIGIITIQILKASGCRVVGVDISNTNFDLAKKLGCDDCFLLNEETEILVESFSNGFGVDATLITAGTKSNVPIELALAIGRKKSKIVIVGSVGMKLPRKDFYEKEIDIRISCSYGPGRYDSDYEEKGIDYPYGFVRWTENRNMSSILELIEQKKLDIKSIITHTYNIDQAIEAYDLITGKKEEKYLGVVIKYDDASNFDQHFKRSINVNKSTSTTDSNINIGFIGAGNFAQSYLLPNLGKLAQLQTVCTNKPVNSKSVAEKFGFKYATTDPDEIFSNDSINTVFIATRHDTHAKYVLAAIKANKNVFVEKPLAITQVELTNIQEANINNSNYLLVGFNRRFSKPIIEIKNFFKNIREPLVMNFRVHAGYIPKEHWVQGTEQGGRIVGEACHFIDTMQYLTSSSIQRVFATSINTSNSKLVKNDNINVALEFSDGSIGNLQYLSNGDSSVPKEMLEVFGSGKTAIMNNFKRVDFFENNRITKKKYDGSKGHKEEIEHFLSVIKGENNNPISSNSLFETTAVTFKILESLRNSMPVEL